MGTEVFAAGGLVVVVEAEVVVVGAAGAELVEIRCLPLP